MVSLPVGVAKPKPPPFLLCRGYQEGEAGPASAQVVQLSAEGICVRSWWLLLPLSPLGMEGIHLLRCKSCFLAATGS